MEETTTYDQKPRISMFVQKEKERGKLSISSEHFNLIHVKHLSQYSIAITSCNDVLKIYGTTFAFFPNKSIELLLNLAFSPKSIEILLNLAFSPKSIEILLNLAFSPKSIEIYRSK